MANTRLNIIVSLQDAASKNAKRIQTEVRGIGPAAQSAAGGVKSLYGGLVGIAALFAGTKFLGSAIQTFKEFDDVMRQVGAVSNATAEELEALTNIAKEMGAKTRFSASEAAEGLRLLSMAGFEAQESIDALPGVLNLAAAGSIDLGTAADIATNVLAGFGLEVENLGQVNDVLVKTFTSSNTTLSELGESFKLVGPIAKGVGADFEDLLASIGKLGDAGLKGSLAGTALRGAINALFNPTKEEAKLLQELAGRIGQTEIQIKDASGNFVGFARIIEQLEAAGLKGEEALALFGQRAGPGMAALLQVGSQTLREFQEDLQGAGGTADKVAADMEAGIGGAARQLAAAFEALKISFGEAFGDDSVLIINGFRDVLLDLINIVEDLKQNGTLDSWGVAIRAVLASVTVTVKTLVAALDDLAKLTTALVFVVAGDLGSAKEAIKDFGQTTIKVFEDMEKEVRNATEKTFKIDPNTLELKQVVDAYGNVIKDASKPSGPIGTGIDEITTLFKKGIFDIEKAYNDDLITLDQYYDKRKDLVTKKITDEINILKQKLLATGNLDEQKRINNQILSLQIDLQKRLAQLDVDRNNKIEQARQERLQKEETELKTALIRTQANLDMESALLEEQHNSNLISLQDYYDQRAAIVKQNIAAEIAILKNASEGEDDVTKKALIDAKIYALEQELQTKIIELRAKRSEEEKKLSDAELKSQEKVNDLKLKAEQVYNDQIQRIRRFQQGDSLAAQFNEELIALQEKQAKELETIQDFNTAKLELARQQSESELEIKRLQAENEQAIKDQQALQDQERFALITDQMARQKEQEMRTLADVAGGASSLFQDLYEMLGSKNKALFIASKAAAVAESIINTSLAVTKAFADPGGYAGMALGAVIAVKGAIETAKIASSKGYAEGGMIGGISPSITADDKMIRATSGEYIEPVKSIQHYGPAGISFLEAFRKRSLSRDFFSSLNFGSMPIHYGRTSFASGGMVTAPASNSLQQDQSPTIINVLDPSIVGDYLATYSGKKQIVNIMKRNKGVLGGV